jgi:CHAT domain-containing protein/uncharacterized membrane protein YidH (DUF202 family)
MADRDRPDGFDPAVLDADFEVPKVFRGRGALTAMREGAWVPVGLDGETVLVATATPDEGLVPTVRQALGRQDVRLLPTDPAVVRRILDNTMDVCPGFPPEASRVDLAKVRTYLAARRSFLAGFRTTLARGRTGLAMFRTGIAFLTVMLVLLRVFGLGWSLPLEGLLLGLGLFFIADGIVWYLPTRRMSRRGLPQAVPVPDPALGNTGVLAVSADLLWPCFRWLPAVPGARAMRAAWALLSPVARRRFLAMDRTSLAERRNVMASLRTRLAQGRTGLSFLRTGFNAVAVGLGLLAWFGTAATGWTIFNLVLLAGGPARTCLLSGLGLLLGLACSGQPAWALSWIQTTPWKVEGVRPADGGPPYCQASATFLYPEGFYLEGELILEVFENEKASLVFRKTKAFPEWMEVFRMWGKGTRSVADCRFWFDERPMWPLRYAVNLENLDTWYDLDADRQFLEELAVSHSLKLELEPGVVAEGPDGRFVRDTRLFSVMVLANTSRLSREIRSCLVSLGRPQAAPAAVVLDPPVTDFAAPTPMPVRLREARQAEERARAGEAAARLASRLALGRAAAEALRLDEASQVLGAVRDLVARGEPLTPAIRDGLERLFEVLLLAERVDDAFAVASLLPDNKAMLAAVALVRGDYQGGQMLVTAAASHILGVPVKDWNELSTVSGQHFPIESVDDLSPPMRRLFLLWGLAAFGQEQALVHNNCGNCVYPVSFRMPAAAASFQVGNWVDWNMLREGAPDTPLSRRDLGLAAFWRGASLLRAGYLERVEIDLDDALFELRGKTGADGWIWRVRVYQAELVAARGRTFEALDAIRGVIRGMVPEIGVDSLPWLEAKALESELAERGGEAESAVAAARDGLEAAARLLPREHSLRLRLQRAWSAGLLGQGRYREAAVVAMAALGLPRPPALSAQRMRELFTRMEALPKISPGSGENGQVEPASDAALRARHDLLAAALGLPAMPGNMPVTARFERIKFVGPLSRLPGNLPGQEEVNGVQATRLALLYDELRAEARLRGSYVGGRDRYADRLVDVARGNDLVTNFPKEPGRGEALQAAHLDALPKLYRAALDWCSLAAMFPGERRQSLLPGEAQAGLEIVLATLRRMALATADPEARLDIVQQALAHVQAASRGDVLATLLTRTLLVGDPDMKEEYRHDARQAIDGEMWLRRERGMLRQAIAQANEFSAGVDRDRALIRQRVLPMPFYETNVSNKFSAHLIGGDAGPAQRAQSTSWVGAMRYAFRIDKAQQRLGDDEAIVVWFPLGKTTEIFVIRKNTCVWERSSHGQAALGRLVKTVRDALAKAAGQLGGTVTTPFPVQEAQALYQALFGPIAGHLAGVSRLYTAQLGIVGGLPLGLLPLRPPGPGEEPDWLADHFAVTRLPALVSPEVFDRRPDVPSPGARQLLLAAGDPEGQAPAGQARGPEDGVVARSIASIDDLRNKLANARQEMETVAGLLGLAPAEQRQSVLFGSQATRRTVLDRLRQGGYKYLLFATHGLMGREDVDIGEPALVLSPEAGRRTLDDDGLLRASDIVGLKLRTDLVILSACQTSPSGEDGAEPLAGLASAFLVAGAEAVLSTQWPVHTRVTEQISTTTVSGIEKAGQRPAVALQQAMRRIRSRLEAGRELRHPVYWAPYELIAFPRQ